MGAAFRNCLGQETYSGGLKGNAVEAVCLLFVALLEPGLPGYVHGVSLLQVCAVLCVLLASPCWNECPCSLSSSFRKLL